MQSDHRRVADAIGYLAERWRDQPALNDTAAHVGLSPHHFQRLFRRLTGVSPKRFVQSMCADHAERLLEGDAPLLEAAIGAGLSGPGRLHDLVVSVRAMTPGELRRGGEGLTLRWGVHDTPFGACFVAVTERGVAELMFVERGEDPAESLAARWPGADRREDEGSTSAVVERMLDASRREGPLTLHLRGTNFQIRVWKALLAIPHGRVTTYGAIAASIGRPTAPRAVGRAVGTNPVSVLIPCHRVLTANGALGGYRWGTARKRALLAWEGSGDGA